MEALSCILEVPGKTTYQHSDGARRWSIPGAIAFLLQAFYLMRKRWRFGSLLPCSSVSLAVHSKQHGMIHGTVATDQPSIESDLNWFFLQLGEYHT